jgi:hypothetical protein
MGEPKLRSYFRGSNVHRALAAYAEEMAGPAWSVAHKMDLYDAAYRAYDPAVSDSVGIAAFKTIYDALSSSDWGAFRPLGASKCWPMSKIYDTIRRSLMEFSPALGVSLANLRLDRRPSVTFAMRSLAGIKPTNHYPTMTVSKFLHFFNPNLFPIWDNAVVDQRAFKRFGVDYSEFCTTNHLDANAIGEEFLGNYFCWGRDLVSYAGKEYMPLFVGWLRDEIPPRRFRKLEPARLAELYAVAFEFTLIGAAIAEGY